MGRPATHRASRPYRKIAQRTTVHGNLRSLAAWALRMAQRAQRGALYQHLKAQQAEPLSEVEECERQKRHYRLVAADWIREARRCRMHLRPLP